MILLSRDDFRNGVFARDKNKCVICGAPGQDAHHIIERRLFPDGGYYLGNGATLCADHHLQAEQTVLSCEEIRKAAGIEKIILPPHLYPDYDYTKWSDILNPNGSRYPGELFWDESVQKILASGKVLNLYLNRIKYSRTFHCPWSPGRTDDDRVLEDCSQFEGKEVVVTVKMDGENTTAYQDGYIHARSIDSENHPSRNWVKNFLSQKLFDLPTNFRLCGENLYAKHSIHYSGLESYFYLFSVWDDRNNCLSWDDTVEWGKLLDLAIVPVLYRGPFDEKLIKELFKPNFEGNECEGYILRLTAGFSYGNFRRSVAKYVRQDHVQTSKHWVKTKMVPNNLK